MKNLLILWYRNIWLLAVILATPVSFSFANTDEGPNTGKKGKVTKTSLITISDTRGLTSYFKSNLLSQGSLSNQAIKTY